MFRKLFAASRVRKVQPIRRRPRIEALEDRCVPATLVGLSTTNQLLTFDSSAPTTILTQNQITGLQGGDSIVGIDSRSATGELYGLGSTGRLYTLDPLTGVATFKVQLAADPTDTTNPFTTLQGLAFGLDFNPTVDRLRVVSSTGQNLRINVDTGLVNTDTPLNYATGDANVGQPPAVSGSAYTNPDNDPGTSTTLFGIDFLRDVVVTQNPPNDGTLTTVGSLGVNTSRTVGFDVASDGTVFASLTPLGTRRSNLYTIDTTTGAATLVGSIGTNIKLKGLAIVETATPVFAVTTANNLISFNAEAPGVLTSSKAITGLQTGETILGIDFRPATGVLYGLGSTGALYTINTNTGRATAGPTLAADPADTTSPFAGITGTVVGIDFNPTVDRLRVVTTADENLRINVDTGLVTTDTALQYATGDANVGADPNIVGSAYTNNFPGATTTVLQAIDSALDILATQNPPNNGTLNTVGALNANTDTLAGFDISSGGVAYAALNLQGDTTSTLFLVDLVTGALTQGKVVGGGAVLTSMAVAPSVVQFSRASVISSVGEEDGTATITVIRRGDTSGTVSVNYAASDDTATLTADYLAATGTLTFAPGEVVKSFQVSIVSDLLVEGDETVALQLTLPTGGSGATLGRRVLADLVIVDNDDAL